MFTLVGRDVFWIVPVAIIAARELVISVYRSAIGTRGVSLPASRAAKYKTVAQQLAVGFALCPVTALDATWLWNLCLWAAVVLAVYSAVQYFWRMHMARAAAVIPSDVSVV
jgi:CDP-diacylglycerol--glycerol-3-phosphate 3-phosphatidyltransferase